MAWHCWSFLFSYTYIRIFKQVCVSIRLSMTLQPWAVWRSTSDYAEMRKKLIFSYTSFHCIHWLGETMGQPYVGTTRVYNQRHQFVLWIAAKIIDFICMVGDTPFSKTGTTHAVWNAQQNCDLTQYSLRAHPNISVWGVTVRSQWANTLSSQETDLLIPLHGELIGMISRTAHSKL